MTEQQFLCEIVELQQRVNLVVQVVCEVVVKAVILIRVIRIHGQ